MKFKPEGYPSLAPYVIAAGAQRVIDFLAGTFDARVTRRYNRESGVIKHAEIQIDDSIVMLADSTDTIQAFPVILHVYVPDVVEAYTRALAAGGTSVQAPKLDEDAAERRSGVRGPAGNTWYMATQLGSPAA
ncbi:MAG: VOC family protein [Bacteroidota bacterium]